MNYYHINNLLNKKKSEDNKNKNNIIIPKSQNEYQNLKIFFDKNNKLDSSIYDNELIIELIILIQKMYRGYIIRKKFTQIYKYVRYYLIILQRNIRGFLTRTKYLRFIDCLKKIVLIQIFYKKYFQRKLRAIELIQKNFRIFFEKKIEKINLNYQKGISNLFMSGFTDEKIGSNNKSSYKQKKKFLYALNNIKKKNYNKEINKTNKIQKYNNKQINNINANKYCTNVIRKKEKGRIQRYHESIFTRNKSQKNNKHIII